MFQSNTNSSFHYQTSKVTTKKKKTRYVFAPVCPRLHPFSVPSHSCNTRTPSCGCYNDGVEYISACLVLFWECTFDEAIVSATYNAQFLCVSSVMSFQSDPTVHGASPLLYIWFLLLNCEVKCRISPMFIYLSSSCFESQSRLIFLF